MERMIMDDLMRWKDDPCRRPLLLTGVRQCGKTYILQEFGRRFFRNTVYLNFQNTRGLDRIFEGSLERDTLLAYIGAYVNSPVVPGETLLILDEVQECPAALESLKFFAEEVPALHVAAAGSLLGVTLAKGRSFPVGKVDRLVMFPMNFGEFLRSAGEDLLAETASGPGRRGPLPGPLHERLVAHLREYMVVGGMPDVVRTWRETRDVTEVTRRQTELLADYRDDFEKHAGEDLDRMLRLWDSVPMQLARENGNRKFKWSDIGDGTKSREYRRPLDWLAGAGLVHVVHCVKRPDVPLRMHLSEDAFKVYMCDIGLMRAHAGYPPRFAYAAGREFALFKGAVAENLALCEMLSHGIRDVAYWRDGRSEVDFVVSVDGANFPVEVKAETKASAASLGGYIDRFHPSRGFLLSMNPRSDSETLSRIPLYDVPAISDVAGRGTETGSPDVYGRRVRIFSVRDWTMSDSGCTLTVRGAEMPVEVLRKEGEYYSEADADVRPADGGAEVRSGEPFDGMAVWTPHAP